MPTRSSLSPSLKYALRGPCIEPRACIVPTLNGQISTARGLMVNVACPPWWKGRSCGDTNTDIDASLSISIFQKLTREIPQRAKKVYANLQNRRTTTSQQSWEKLMRSAQVGMQDEQIWVPVAVAWPFHCQVQKVRPPSFWDCENW